MALDLQAFSIYDSAGNQILADVNGFLQVNVTAQTLGTISVAGTVTANIGTTGGLALDATLTGGTQQTKVTDGTNIVTVKAASTAAVAADKALVVAVSPNNTVAVTQSTSPWVVSLTSTTITGTVAVTQSTSPWVVSGTVTANIGTTGGLALDTSVNGLLVAQGSTTSGEKGPLVQGAVTTAAPTYVTAQTSPLSLTVAGALRVDGSGVTQPVSGTVTANQGGAPWTVKPDGTVWTLTGTSANVDVTNTVTVSGTVTANQGGNWTTRIVGNAGGVVDFAGQNATAPANAILMGGEFNTTPTTIGSGNASPLQLDASGNLKVNITAQSSSGASDTVGSTAALNALNVAATVVMAGEASVGFLLAAGTLVGTIVPEISMDGGTTWTGTYFFDPTTLSFSPSVVFGAANGTIQRSILASGGVSNCRVRVSAFTSGTANATLRATQGLQGVQFSSAIDGEKATYRAISTLFYTSAATPTDSFIMSGSSTKTIRINKIFVQIFAPSNSGLVNMQIIKRSAANTGGTFVSDATNGGPMDSNDAATTVATAGHYTANPTALGAQLIVVDQQKMLLPTSPNAFQIPSEFDFGSLPGAKSLVLRGTTQFACVNFAGSALPTGGMQVSVIFQYTEE